MAEMSAVRSSAFASYRVGTGDIDASTLALVEELCQRFQLGVGLANVKLNFQNGRFEHAWLERRVQKAQLADAYERPRG